MRTYDNFPDIFIHFLDHEVLELYNIEGTYSEEHILAETSAAAKLGYILTTGSLMVPITSFFESSVARVFLPPLRPLAEIGDLEIISSAEDYTTFISVKREQYKNDRERYPLYFREDGIKALLKLNAPLRLRRKSSTKDITSGWKSSIVTGADIWPALFKSGFSGPAELFERTIESVPERLDGSAFIWKFVKSLLPIQSISPRNELALKRLISEHYIRSYLDEFTCMILSDLAIGDLSLGAPIHRLFPLRLARRFLRLANLEVDLIQLSWTEAVQLRYLPSFASFASLLRSWMQNPDMAYVAQVLRGLPVRSSWSGFRPYERVVAVTGVIATALANDDRLLGKSVQFAEELVPREADAPPTPLIINLGNVYMTHDQYKVGQAGAVGPGSHAEDMTFNQVWNETAAQIDVSQLARDLAVFRTGLIREASEPEQFVAIGEIAAAEQAALAGDGPSSLRHLKKAGSWVWDVGSKIGIGVAVVAAKAALGL